MATARNWNIYMSDELHDKLTTLAKFAGKSFSGILTQLGEEFLERNAEKLKIIEENNKLFEEMR